jgi:hypothetical protein
MTIGEIFLAIELELKHAEKNWPDWPEDLIHGAAIVSEEAGELVRAANNGGQSDSVRITRSAAEYDSHMELSREMMATEAIQTAAMAVRFLKNLEYEV